MHISIYFRLICIVLTLPGKLQVLEIDKECRGSESLRTLHRYLNGLYCTVTFSYAARFQMAPVSLWYHCLHGLLYCSVFILVINIAVSQYRNHFYK